MAHKKRSMEVDALSGHVAKLASIDIGPGKTPSTQVNATIKAALQEPGVYVPQSVRRSVELGKGAITQVASLVLQRLARLHSRPLIR